MIVSGPRHGAPRSGETPGRRGPNSATTYNVETGPPAGCDEKHETIARFPLGQRLVPSWRVRQVARMRPRALDDFI